MIVCTYLKQKKCNNIKSCCTSPALEAGGDSTTFSSNAPKPQWKIEEYLEGLWKRRSFQWRSTLEAPLYRGEAMEETLWRQWRGHWCTRGRMWQSDSRRWVNPKSTLLQMLPSEAATSSWPLAGLCDFQIFTREMLTTLQVQWVNMDSNASWICRRRQKIFKIFEISFCIDHWLLSRVEIWQNFARKKLWTSCLHGRIYLMFISLQLSIWSGRYL